MSSLYECTTDSPLTYVDTSHSQPPRPIIEVQDVSLRFALSYDKAWTIRDHLGKAAQYLRGTQTPKRYFQALNSVSLSVNAGEVLGIIGANGSGKTTLLRLISGIFQPDTGRVNVHGRISSLLALGTGFNREMSGEANLKMNALLSGVPRDRVDDKIREAAEFTELGEFLEVPMKFYSNGMISRLNFATLLMVDPEVLLIDEIFSVGDLAFERKSRNAMEHIIKSAKCQLIVTHSLPMVTERCTRAIWFEGGQIVADGPPQEIVDAYREAALHAQRTVP